MTSDLPTILYTTILYFRKVQFEGIPATYVYFPFSSEKEASLISPMIFQNKLAFGLWKNNFEMSGILTPQSEMKLDSLNLCALSKTHTYKQTDTDIYVLYLAEIYTMGQKETKKWKVNCIQFTLLFIFNTNYGRRKPVWLYYTRLNFGGINLSFRKVHVWLI